MQIVILYSPKDGKKQSQNLETVLTSRGYTAWTDAQIPFKQTWDEATRDAIHRAETIVVITTKGAMRDNQVQGAIDYAQNVGKPVVAWLTPGFDQDELPLRLRKTAIDARVDFDEAVDVLHEKLLPQPVPQSVKAQSKPALPDKPKTINMQEKENTSLPSSRARRLPSGCTVTIEIALTAAGLVLAFLALFPQGARDNLLYNIGLLEPSPTAAIVSETPTATPTVTPDPTETPRHTEMPLPTDAVTVTLATRSPVPTATTTIVSHSSPTAAIQATTVALPIDAPFTDVGSLNAWRVTNGFAPLNSNDTLDALALRHQSAISARPLNELGDLSLNSFGQSIQEMASTAGYPGNVLMVAYAGEDVLTLAQAITALEDQGGPAVHTAYTREGFSSSTNPVSGYTYIVLILGQ